MVCIGLPLHIRVDFSNYFFHILNPQSQPRRRYFFRGENTPSIFAVGSWKIEPSKVVRFLFLETGVGRLWCVSALLYNQKQLLSLTPTCFISMFWIYFACFSSCSQKMRLFYTHVLDQNCACFTLAVLHNLRRIGKKVVFM